jgi:hypothetical protein
MDKLNVAADKQKETMDLLKSFLFEKHIPKLLN